MPKSIIIFTLHKSASTFLFRQSQLLSKLAGIELHSPNLRKSGLSARDLITDSSIWTTRKGCIAPVRFYVDVPNMDEFDVLLHLRDPRDVLVSMFYSYCYIHGGEVDPNSGYRREVAARGIDAFVLDKTSDNSNQYLGDYGTGGHVEDLIGNLPQRYHAYLDNLASRQNVTVLKYEEMVTDYASWIRRFSAPFPLDNREDVINNLISREDEFFPKRDQDKMQHVRHITPGDHKNKLKPETIAQLNVEYADILAALDYPI